MIFSLEVLQAKHGDCLLLHFGDNDNPRVFIIDGGPSGIYSKVLKPRLLRLKETRFPGEPLPIAMVMISHADDDHINGIVMLTNDLANKQRNDEGQEFSIDNFWFNSFDDIIGNIQIPVISSIGASGQAASITAMGFPVLNGAPEHIQAVIASTGQGRQIRDNADFLTLAVNLPFDALEPGKANLVRGDSRDSVVDFADLKITVVHPNEQRLKDLQQQWDKDLKKAKEAGDPNIVMASIAAIDKSPFNLSSIVCLAEAGGKKILLTGDGRSDDILEGLSKNHLLDNDGKLHVDILKMPHHGSDANMSAEFLQCVTADHYVISADGSNHNPDQGLLDLIRANVKKGTMHLTNHEGEFDLKGKLDAFIAKLEEENHELKVVFRTPGKPSFLIELLDELAF